MKKIRLTSFVIVFAIAFLFSGLSFSSVVSQFLIPCGYFQDVITWNVGDYTTYTLNLGFLGSGSVKKSVVKDEETSLWLKVEAKIPFGDQNIDIQIRKADGKVLKMIINGKEQPNLGDHKIKIIEKRPEEVKVPAWDQPFKTIFVKVKDETDDAEVDTWINPNTLPNQPKTPLEGSVKMIIKKGFLTSTMELSEYGFSSDLRP